MKKLTCRLMDVMWAKHATVEDLSEMTGIDADRLKMYCKDTLEEINLREAEKIMDALGCQALSDLFEYVEDPPAAQSDTRNSNDEWHSPCPRGGRHDWYKDMDVSNSIYQEYECRACGRRIHIIW